MYLSWYLMYRHVELRFSCLNCDFLLGLEHCFVVVVVFLNLSHSIGFLFEV